MNAHSIIHSDAFLVLAADRFYPSCRLNKWLSGPSCLLRTGDTVTPPMGYFPPGMLTSDAPVLI